MDTAEAAVAGKAEDNGCWLDHNILASAEAGADTSLAVGQETEAFGPGSTEVVHQSLWKINHFESKMSF